jgi:hypothetical protein
LQEARSPELEKNSRFKPFSEAAVRRRRGANPRGIQGIPLTPRSQSEEDCIHGIPRRNGRIVATQWMLWARWEQRLDFLPQRVRNAPAIIFRNQPHFICLHAALLLYGIGIFSRLLE